MPNDEHGDTMNDEPRKEQPIPSILVVDDTAANLGLLCGILKERGYKARPVLGGEFALQAAAASPPDLILLDIDMPGMTGFEVCERLKANPALGDIPVIFVSALTEVAAVVRGFSVGGVDYITKPFQFEEVHARVATHLELRKKRRELQESYDRLRELEQLRDSLVHMIIHDMRSPLTALIGNLEFLKGDLAGHINGQSMEDIDQALSGGKRLNRMANDLLDVSRLEAGRMPLLPRECDLAEVIRSAIVGFMGLAADRDIRFEPTCPLLVSCDEGLIRRVAENLISNGLKHKSAGHTLHVSLAVLDQEVRVAVEDDGPGIPAGYREKIFEKFGVVQARHEQEYHSVGLGLAFCKLAVEAHSGRIGVDSEEGKGSTFWFTLPRKGPKAS